MIRIILKLKFKYKIDDRVDVYEQLDKKKTEPISRSKSV